MESREVVQTNLLSKQEERHSWGSKPSIRRGTQRRAGLGAVTDRRSTARAGGSGWEPAPAQRDAR